MRLVSLATELESTLGLKKVDEITGMCTFQTSESWSWAFDSSFDSKLNWKSEGWREVFFFFLFFFFQFCSDAVVHRGGFRCDSGRRPRSRIDWFWLAVADGFCATVWVRVGFLWLWMSDVFAASWFHFPALPPCPPPRAHSLTQRRTDVGRVLATWGEQQGKKKRESTADGEREKRSVSTHAGTHHNGCFFFVVVVVVVVVVVLSSPPPFSRGFPRCPSILDRFLPSFTGFYWVSRGFTGFYWVLLGFTGFYWVLQGLTGFYKVLLVFTGFYWVSRGFTRFYWVLLGSTGFNGIFLGFTGFYWFLRGFTGFFFSIGALQFYLILSG